MEQIFKKVKPQLEQGNVVCFMGFNTLVRAVAEENVILEILKHDEKEHWAGTGKELTVMSYKRFHYWILS